MRNIITVFILILIFLHVKSFLTPTYAADTAYLYDLSIINADPPIDQELYKPESNYTITIKSKNKSFEDIPYLVLEYPQSIEAKPAQYSNYLSHKVEPEGDHHTINVELDLAKKGLGASNPGAWIIKVCSASSIKDCGDKNNILGVVQINVANPLPTPTPTIPQGFPIINQNGQEQCVFTPGSRVKLKVDNLEGQNLHQGRYRWWWAEGKNSYGKNRLARFDEKPENITLTIQPEETTKPGLRKLCIAQHPTLSYKSPPENENCIILKFTNDPDQLKDTSCSEANAGANPIEPPTPIPTPSLPQCSEWANLQGTPIPTPQLYYIKQHKIETTDLKCIAVNTAVGDISTEPFGFLKSILSVILGLSGGVAVLLIIVSGYRFMASQGNPEAVKAAQEQLTSAIVGFLFIIFSLVILQVIGVDILHIPGFGK